MRKFRVGSLYEFHAEDEAHAIEQYLDAIEPGAEVDVNFCVEIGTDDEGGLP
jgi:hypothetical protein